MKRSGIRKNNRGDLHENISDIDYLPFVIRGKDIYRSRSELFGYSMDEVLALELEDLAFKYL